MQKLALQKGANGSGAKLVGPATPASASSWRQEHHYRDSPTPSIEVRSSPSGTSCWSVCIPTDALHSTY
jgi:hypothetical protein